MANATQTTPQQARPQTGERRYLRFDLLTRIEHWIFMLSFSTLGLTGLVQKYASAELSVLIIKWLGGIENTRQIHHVAATVMMVVTVYHLGIVGYRLYVRRVKMTMLPGLADARAAWETLLYNLGKRKERVQQGRYTFEEKLEYWAVIWGTVVMAITGFMMWNPIATSRFLPGQFVPAAKAAHGGEALLAVLSILIWHLYHVIVRHFNRSMFTGTISESEMLHEHPLELADIKAGMAIPPLDRETRRKRLRRFLPTYLLIAAVLVAGIYWFVTFEETAITTLPPAEQVTIYVPLTPTPLPTPIPTRTPPPGGMSVWEGAWGNVFSQRCTICHNDSAMIGGLDLGSYESALNSGANGPAVLPGQPEQSPLYLVQSAGGHAEQLNESELEQLFNWIEAGAPEN